MNKEQIIQLLSLERHIEGGYFSRTYSSELAVVVPYDSKPRLLMSSIYYLLTDDSPIGYLHRNKSDIIHFFHGGSPLVYLIIHPDGKLERTILGNDLARGERPQLILRGGSWKATELPAGQYGLVGEAVSPGFEYADMEMAQERVIRRLFPHLWDEISRYVKS